MPGFHAGGFCYFTQPILLGVNFTGALTWFLSLVKPVQPWLAASEGAWSPVVFPCTRVTHTRHRISSGNSCLLFFSGEWSLWQKPGFSCGHLFWGFFSFPPSFWESHLCLGLQPPTTLWWLPITVVNYSLISFLSSRISDIQLLTICLYLWVPKGPWTRYILKWTHLIESQAVSYSPVYLSRHGKSLSLDLSYRSPVLKRRGSWSEFSKPPPITTATSGTWWELKMPGSHSGSLNWIL